MNRSAQILRGLLFCSVAALFIFLASFGRRPQAVTGTVVSVQDTVPKKDLDNELQQLDKADQQLNALQQKDWDNIRQDVESALQKIDLKKIQAQTEEALKKIDVDRIREEVENSLASIDLDKIQSDLESSINKEEMQEQMDKVKAEIANARKKIEEQLKNADWQKNMQEELQKVNREEIRKSLESARKEIEKAREELRSQKLDMKEELQKGHREIENARRELKGYQELIYSLEDQGLLDTHKDYRIEYRNGLLTVNGNALGEENSSRYKKYFDKDSVTISKKDGKIRIDND